jgi:hypothetical protein
MNECLHKKHTKTKRLLSWRGPAELSTAYQLCRAKVLSVVLEKDNAVSENNVHWFA